MVILVRATMDDAARLFEWRTDPATRESSHSAAPASFEHHRAWLERTLQSPNVRLYVARDPQRNEWIGTCRLDREAHCAMISLTVSPHERGRGYAAQILSALQREAIDWGIDTLTASVRASNTVSQRAFTAANFRERHRGETDEIVEFELLLGEDARQPRVEPT